MYSEKLMNEFFNPQNYGVIKGASGVGKVTCDVGGEIIKIYISVEEDRVVDAQFQTFGGVVAIAASSVATQLMKNKAVSTVAKYTYQNICEVLGDVPESKMYVVQAVAAAMTAAVNNYKRKSQE